MAKRRGIGRVIGWVLAILFLGATSAGPWLPPTMIHAFEKDYHFPEVTIDATVLPNGDLVLEESRTFDFRNGPFTYAYFNIDDPTDIDNLDGRVRDFTISESLRSPIPGGPTGSAGINAWRSFQAAAPSIVMASMATPGSGSSSGGFGSSSSSNGFSGGGFSGGGGGGGGGTSGGAG